jgi:microcystin-dependent protein
MSEPFVGEIRCFGFNFAPVGWAFCDGQLIAIPQNETLFVLIGTTYGGDGVNTFALPNLQSRVPIHMGTFAGTTFVQGQAAGVENVTLTANELPAHSHVLTGTGSTANVKRPLANSVYATSSSGNAFYAAPGTLTALAATTVSSTGGNQPHSNIQPYLTFSWCISMFGIFPSQS